MGTPITGKIYICKSEEIPYEVRILYRAPSGRTGFAADKVGEVALGTMLEGSFVWDFRNAKVKHYKGPSRNEDAVSFFDYLMLRSSLPCTDITYRLPSGSANIPIENSVFESLPRMQDPTEQKQAILSLTDDFCWIALWDAVLGATIFTKNISDLMETLRNTSNNSGAALIHVQCDEMPVW
jgi:hypothetical protein